MGELPGKLGSTSVVFHGRNEFGHVDHLGTEHHGLVLEAVVAQWLRDRVFD